MHTHAHTHTRAHTHTHTHTHTHAHAHTSHYVPHCPGHPDSARIKVRQSELDSACADLQKLASSRHNRLKESLKLQEFYRKAEEEESWIKEKEQIVSSSEVGRGLSHVLR